MNNSNVPMPNRERFLTTSRGERPGDVYIADWFNRPLPETPDEWIKQGAPKEIKDPNFFAQYFQFKHIRVLDEITSGARRADLMKIGGGLPAFFLSPPVVPLFERIVLREDERTRVETTYGGQTVEVNKEFPWRMPKYIDHPVKDWATWKEYKKRLDPDTPERWPADWNAFVEERNGEDAPTFLLLGGFFGFLREWMGLERLLFAFHDTPELVEDMMDTMLHLEMGVARRAFRDLKIDWVRFWEDMAYKSGPLISPDMFKKFMIPRYKQILDFVRSNGIHMIQVDSDGNINELIPIWLECGLNSHWPLECAAGMDAVALRKKYGKDVILAGNIDKMAFAKGKEAIREEVMSKVPFLVETGGYFPGLDHNIPPDISFDNYRYFINLLREIGGMDKLPE